MDATESNLQPVQSRKDFEVKGLTRSEFRGDSSPRLQDTWSLIYEQVCMSHLHWENRPICFTTGSALAHYQEPEREQGHMPGRDNRPINHRLKLEGHNKARESAAERLDVKIVAYL